MADTLSQSEIDALRDAVKTGTVPDAEDNTADESASQIKISEYNFRKPRLLSADQDHFLKIIHDQMAKDLQTELSANLKTAIEIKLVAIDQISYGEYILSLGSPTFLISGDTDPYMGSFAVDINTAIASAMIDILLGGKGADEYEIREITPLEMDICESVIDVLLEILKTGWSGKTAIDFKLMARDTNPEYLQLVSPEAPCINITLDIHLGNTTGVFNICYPFTLIQSIFNKARSMSAKASSVDDGQILSAMGVVTLDVFATIGNCTISAEQLGLIKEGDTLCLDRRYDQPVDVYLGENLSFKGRPGKHKGKASVQLLKLNSAASKKQNKEVKQSKPQIKKNNQKAQETTTPVKELQPE